MKKVEELIERQPNREKRGREERLEFIRRKRYIMVPRKDQETSLSQGEGKN